MRGNGVGDSGETIFSDLAAFDQLPPAARAALNYSVINWSPAKVLARMRRLYSLTDPDDDEDIARELLTIDRARTEATAANPLTYPAPELKVILDACRKPHAAAAGARPRGRFRHHVRAGAQRLRGRPRFPGAVHRSPATY